MSIRVRFAPSPTGSLHIGGLRTALYNELLANRHGGDFILRIEDTDQARFVEGGIENICRSLKDVGIIPNEGVWIQDDGTVFERGSRGPYLQSKRKSKHLEYAMELMKMDKAYYCFCSSDRLDDLRKTQQLNKKPTMYDGKCRTIAPAAALERVEAGEPYVIRLKLPKNGSVSVWDAVRDEVTFEWKLIDDQVIIKSDGFPTYHLAAICDDHDMEITHVLRGEEWLSSTPKHLFIFDAFGWTPPKYAHLPLLLNKDRSKLSKRQGDVAVEDYLKNGYLPETLINFVALLGWNPSSDKEIYSHNELVEAFDLAKINRSGAIFNIEKLIWMNEYYIKNMPLKRYLELTRPFVQDKTNDVAFMDRCLLLVRDRLRFPQEVIEHTESFFTPAFDFSNVSIAWKTQSPQEALERLQGVRDLVAGLSDEDLTKTVAPMELETRIKHFIQEKKWGNGDTLWPLRVALSGSERSPTPFELLHIYGKERSLKRIDEALASLR